MRRSRSKADHLDYCLDPRGSGDPGKPGVHSGHHPRDWLLASGRGVVIAADRDHHTRLVVRHPRSHADRLGAQATVVWPTPHRLSSAPIIRTQLGTILRRVWSLSRRRQ